MQPIDALWIIGMIGILWFVFLKKDKNGKNSK